MLNAGYGYDTHHLDTVIKVVSYGTQDGVGAVILALEHPCVSDIDAHGGSHTSQGLHKVLCLLIISVSEQHHVVPEGDGWD